MFATENRRNISSRSPILQDAVSSVDRISNSRWTLQYLYTINTKASIIVHNLSRHMQIVSYLHINLFTTRTISSHLYAFHTNLPSFSQRNPANLS
jgi:hypothetical protein